MGAWSWLVELVRSSGAPGEDLEGPAIGSVWAGEILGCPATVHARRDNGWARFEVAGPPGDVSIHRRNGVDELLGGTLVTGDPALDAVARVEGDRLAALVMLEDGARLWVARALAGRLVVDGGAVHGDAPVAEVPDRLREAARVARALTPEPQPFLEVLVQRLESEPVATVRVQILRALVDQGSPWDEAALRIAASDPDAELRLISATQRRDAAALAALALDPAADARSRDRAFLTVRTLAPEALRSAVHRAVLDPPRARIALERSAADPDATLLPAILERGGQLLDDPEALRREGPALLRALDGHRGDASTSLLLQIARRGPAKLALQALLQLRATPVGTLDEIERVRPELGDAIRETRGRLEMASAGEALSRILQLTWNPAQRTAVGTLASLPFEVRLEPGQVGFYVSGLPTNPSLRPRKHGAPPLTDSPFYRALETQGSPSSLAWLPVEQRDRILALLAHAPRLGLQLGRAYAIGPMASGQQLAERARSLAAVVRGFQHLATLSGPARVALAFALEPDAALRRRLATQVIRDSSDAAAEALQDRDPCVRLLAARHLGRPDVLEGVVLQGSEAAVRTDALMALAEIAPQLLDRAVACALAEQDLRGTALQLVGKHRLAAHATTLGLLLDGASGAEPWLPAAHRALCVLKDPSTERHLVAALGSADSRVRRMAILALGQVGSPAAAAPLKALAAGWRVSWEVSAARTAVLAIRARGAVGALSLASVRGGEVTLSPPHGGEMALSDDLASKSSRERR